MVFVQVSVSQGLSEPGFGSGFVKCFDVSIVLLGDSSPVAWSHFVVCFLTACGQVFPDSYVLIFLS